MFATQYYCLSHNALSTASQHSRSDGHLHCNVELGQPPLSQFWTTRETPSFISSIIPLRSLSSINHRRSSVRDSNVRINVRVEFPLPTKGLLDELSYLWHARGPADQYHFINVGRLQIQIAQ